LKILAQLRKRNRLLHAIQILPLQVLDHRHLSRLLVGNLTHNRRDGRPPRNLRSPAAPLAKDQKITTGSSCPHRNRLNHTVSTNRIRQLIQRSRDSTFRNACSLAK